VRKDEDVYAMSAVEKGSPSTWRKIIGEVA